MSDATVNGLRHQCNDPHCHVPGFAATLSRMTPTEPTRDGNEEAFHCESCGSDSHDTIACDPAPHRVPPGWFGTPAEPTRVVGLDRFDMSVYDEIRAERERAHAKHGDTSMESQPWHAHTRLDILVEEVGEVAREYNEARHRGEEHPDPVRLRRELIQVAAMAAAWADAIEANGVERDDHDQPCRYDHDRPFDPSNLEGA